MDLIFEIWPIEYLLIVFAAIIIILLFLLLVFGDHIRYMKRIDSFNGLEKGIYEKKEVRDIDLKYMEEKGYVLSTEKYPKITILSETVLFIPMLIFDSIMVGYYFLFAYEDLEYLVILFLFFMVTIIEAIYSGSKVKQYNKELQKRIIVKGQVIGEIIWHEAEYRKPAYVEIKYSYEDPNGIPHESFQIVNVGVYFFKSMSMKKWNAIYGMGQSIDVLLSVSDYRDSYVPMFENYSRKYGGIYRVHLNLN